MDFDQSAGSSHGVNAGYIYLPIEVLSNYVLTDVHTSFALNLLMLRVYPIYHIGSLPTAVQLQINIWHILPKT